MTECMVKQGFSVRSNDENIIEILKGQTFLKSLTFFY